jgi:two-component system cell cycle response regulator DivK
MLVECRRRKNGGGLFDVSSDSRRCVSGVSAKARLVVLLAEPRDELRELYAECLARNGFHVMEAVDGAEAIDKSLQFHPAALVVDFALDAIDGLRVVRRLRADERTYELPILMMGVEAGSTSALLAENAGADAFLAKPCLPSTLLTEVMKLLARVSAPPSAHSV